MRLVLFVPALMLVCAFSWAPPAVPAPAEGQTVLHPRPRVLSLSAEGIAVSTLLRRVSGEADRVLRAEADIGDYRVDIFLHNKNPEAFQKDLAFLFDHGDTSAGFHWEPVTTEPRQTYELTRSAESRNNEKGMPRELYRLAADWLREFRDAALLAGRNRENAAARAQSPFFEAADLHLDEMTAESLLTLNSGETESLIQTGSLTIPLTRISSEWASRLVDNVNQQVEAARKAKEQNPNIKLPGGLEASSPLSLMLTFQPSQDTPGTFVLQADTFPLRQSHRTGRIMDPLGILIDSKHSQTRLLDESEPSATVDIAEALEKEEYPDDLTTRLRLLAGAARVNIYCEKFPTFRRMRARFASQGKLSVLLNEIANAYKYSVVRRGIRIFCGAGCGSWSGRILSPRRFWRGCGDGRKRARRTRSKTSSRRRNWRKGSRRCSPGCRWSLLSM